jgi:hypothetical protein
MTKHRMMPIDVGRSLSIGLEAHFVLYPEHGHTPTAAQ